MKWNIWATTRIIFMDNSFKTNELIQQKNTKTLLDFGA